MKQAILTSNWSVVQREVKDSNPVFLPVRISVGVPRFWSRAKTFPYLADLAPVGLRKLKDAEFDQAYIERLDGIGVDAIQAQFDELYDNYCKPLVLLCYEKLEAADPADFDRACHRRTLARWFYEQTGYLIQEAQGLGPRTLKRQLGNWS